VAGDAGRLAKEGKMSRDAKQQLREQVRDGLNKLSSEQRGIASKEICLRIEEQELWKKARSILFYAPLGDEPDIWRLLEDTLAAGKNAALPRFIAERDCYVACKIQNLEQDIMAGRFGIREPVEACARLELNGLDLILVPGVAFDASGHRLGRGKGFYDRLLAMLGGPTCGVAFEEQLVDEIPVEAHDVRLNCIVTPTRWQLVAGPRAVLK